MRYLQRNLIYKKAKKSGNGAAISTAAAATGAPGAGFLPSGLSSYLHKPGGKRCFNDPKLL